MRTSLGVLVLLQLAATLSAYKLYQDRIPNGGSVPHPCLANYLWHGVGHKNVEGGGERNPFGIDFAANNYQWDATLCQKDSDGDGQTNGQELGDSNCVWTVGTVPSQTTGLSHPGVCEPLTSATCIAANNWDFCTQTAFSCPQINSTDVLNVTLKLDNTTVPNTETNYYCQAVDLPNDTDYHIIANQPVLDNDYVIHHMLLFGCGADPTNSLDAFKTPQPCTMQSQGLCGTILAGWTVGSVGECNEFPAGVKIGNSTYTRALLQVHWNNPTLRSDYTDGSGMTLYYTANLRTYDMATLTLGQAGLRVPGGQASYTQEGTCSSACTASQINETMNIVGVSLHMHYLGAGGSVEQYRNGVKVATLASTTSFSYDSPTEEMYWPAKELLAGDELKTSCTFKSTTRSSATYYGDGTQNEMCFAFIAYYPAQDFLSCVAIGTYVFCNNDQVTNVDGCSFAATGNTTEIAAYAKLMAQCDTTGASCTSDCRTLLTENPHACLTGNPKIVSELSAPILQGSYGVTVQNAFRSCDEYVYAGSGSAPGLYRKANLSIVAMLTITMLIMM